MTMRDDRKSKGARLDSVRNSRGSDRLTRPIDLARKWSFVTDVRLQENHLVWREAERKRAGSYRLLDGEIVRQAIVARQEAERDRRGILDEFLHLSDADDEAILKYARTWGVLELCCHNLPSSHEFFLNGLSIPAPLLAMPRAERTRRANHPRQCLPLGREPLATWRFFSGQANALLNIVAALEQTRLGDPEDWAKLLRDEVIPGESLDAQKLCTRDVIEGWLWLGRIKPTIDDLTGGLTWAGADLFGELAVQIALLARAREGQVFCVVCGKAHEPKRRVIRRGFNYCPAAQCQRVAGARRAQRYRDRKSTSGQRSRKLLYRGPFQGRTNDPLFSQ